MVCKVAANLTGDILASFLSTYDRVEGVRQLRATATMTARGDNVFLACLNREGFQAIPGTIHLQDRQMMVMVEGRRPHCWNCKQIGHLAKA